MQKSMYLYAFIYISGFIASLTAYVKAKPHIKQ
jgi:hypothetical protein